MANFEICELGREAPAGLWKV